VRICTGCVNYCSEDLEDMVPVDPVMEVLYIAEIEGMPTTRLHPATPGPARSLRQDGLVD
jgi:hypothetical protein